MAHVAAEALRGPERIALATTLREAREIEDVLTGAGVDYVVEVEVYARTLLFGSARHGAVFYVSSSQATYCRAHLAERGFADAIVDDSPENPRT